MRCEPYNYHSILHGTPQSVLHPKFWLLATLLNVADSVGPSPTRAGGGGVRGGIGYAPVWNLLNFLQKLWDTLPCIGQHRALFPGVAPVVGGSCVFQTWQTTSAHSPRSKHPEGMPALCAPCRQDTAPAIRFFGVGEWSGFADRVPQICEFEVIIKCALWGP